MTWFQNVSTLEELRKQYRILLKQYHPDNPGGSVAITQEINKAYEQVFQRLHKKEGSSSENPGNEQHQTEEDEQFRTILQAIIGFDMQIEIIGSWIWCFGGYAYRKQLKQLGFTWAPKKKAWIWHAAPYQRHHREEIPLDQIRAKYGSEVVHGQRKRPVLQGE
ncbi:MAG: J domain-containing protein [Lachnospiraceae bacterium]